MCRDGHTFLAFTSPAFPEKFLAGSRPSATGNSSRSAFSWESWGSSAERPAAPSQPELGAWRGFCVAFAAAPAGCAVLCSLRRVRSTGFGCFPAGRPEHSQVGCGPSGRGLPVPPAPPPPWSSSEAAVRASRVTVLLSRQEACLG